MQSKAATVDEYLKEVPPNRFEAIRSVRALCQEVLGGYEESMTYGMPCYSKNGNVEVAFNSQKQYISIYCLKAEVVDEYRDQLLGANIGKSCIRYTNPAKIDFDLIRSLLVANRESAESPC
jgi:uncharacterized protein YdhG (YjbR/CyaY superfamily)